MNHLICWYCKRFKIRRDQLQHHDPGSENSAQVRARVIKARAQQQSRSACTNSQLDNRQIEKFCKLSTSDTKLLDQAIDKFGLSARAWHRILKLARTIADLEGKEKINTQHLTEAIGYRSLDRSSI